MSLSDKDKNEILLNLSIELNQYLLERWDNLSEESKGILGITEDGWNGEDRREFVLAQWTQDFYKQKILELEDDLRGTKKYLADVIHITNYC